MRIGSSFIPPQLPPRVPNRPDASQSAGDGPASRPKSQGVVRPEFLQRAEEARLQSEDAGFYSMDRNLSLRSQEALNTYITTARFQFQPMQGELMGVDLYV